MSDPVLLCAASGPSVGIGHVVRTASIARQLKASGEPHVVLVEDPESVRWLGERGVDA